LSNKDLPIGLGGSFEFQLFYGILELHRYLF
jgi:hypothetical protein